MEARTTPSAESVEAVNKCFNCFSTSDVSGNGLIPYKALCQVLHELGLSDEIAECFVKEARCISYRAFVDWAFDGCTSEGLSDTKRVKMKNVFSPSEKSRSEPHLRIEVVSLGAGDTDKSRKKLDEQWVEDLCKESGIAMVDGEAFDSQFDETLNPANFSSERQNLAWSHDKKTPNFGATGSKELFASTRAPGGGLTALRLTAKARELTTTLGGTSIFEGTLSASDAVHGKEFTWVRGEVIGIGSMGKVFKALNQKDGVVMAVKEVRLDNSQVDDRKLRASLENELSIVSELRHPRIVSFIGSENIKDNLYIYLEFMPGGSLAQVIQDFGALDESLCARYTHDVVEGLEYLHSRTPVVLHRDIKGANILVSLDARVKLADFGCSKRSDDSNMAASMRGSIPWMAPEVISEKSVGRSADIWSLGCVVIEMCTGKLPWGGFDNHMAALYKIGMSKQEVPIPPHMSREGQDFIKSCVQRDKSKRPSAADLMNHEFIGALVVQSLSDTFF